MRSLIVDALRLGAHAPHRPLLDALLVAVAREDVLHEDAGRDDVIGIDGAGLDQLFDLGDRHARGRGHHGVEVSRGAPVDQVAEAVALPGLDEREVRAQRRLEHVALAVDDPGFLALGHDGAVGRRREEAGDARAGGAHPLGERALRHQFDLELAAQELPLEFLVLADVGRDHLPDLPRPQQDAGAEIVHAGVVADDGEALRAARVQGANQVFRNAAHAEPAHHDARSVGNERHGGVGVGEDFVHDVIIQTQSFNVLRRPRFPRCWALPEQGAWRTPVQRAAIASQHVARSHSC